MQAMKRDSETEVKALRVDGGMVVNNWFLQFLADLLEVPVERPQVTETTALGAAYLAGVKFGIFKSLADIGHYWQRDALFSPRLSHAERSKLLRGWERAVSRVLVTGN
jgi:glycerol kinase